MTLCHEPFLLNLLSSGFDFLCFVLIFFLICWLIYHDLHFGYPLKCTRSPVFNQICEPKLHKALNEMDTLAGIEDTESKNVESVVQL